MHWFLHLPTRIKLSIGFGSLLVLLICAVWFGCYGIRTATAAQERIITFHQKNLMQIIDLRADLNRQREYILELAFTKGGMKQQDLAADLQKKFAESQEHIQSLSSRIQHGDDLYDGLVELKRLNDRYANLHEVELRYITNHQFALAQQLCSGEMEDASEALRAIAQKMADDESRNAQAMYTASQRLEKTLLSIFLAVGLVGVVLGVVMINGLNSMISRPLMQMTGVAGRMATGNLDGALPSTDRRDEVGALGLAFSNMTAYLRNMANTAQRIASNDLTVPVTPISREDALGNAFETMLRNLRLIITESQEAASVLASSVSEMAVSTTQLAASASETATSVSEATTTIAEVRQTAQLATHKAKSVADSAQQAASTAKTGRTAVDESLQVMERIRTQMELIAQSIIQLSEQGQSIGEIIATVTDLAEQSNLLAVNAAIEAAKAGEQGKGFGVVAQEVRNLAEQSKHATRRVRGILNDIQKATSSAVMATEQGSHAVESGMKQAIESGEAIRSLAEIIESSSEAALQIARSSEEQLVGVDQVAVAMDSIKQASLQNMDSARQVQDAAQNLHNLGQKMKQIINQYSV